MKKWILVFLFCMASLPLIAAHLKGGWIQYTYLGAGSSAGTSKYEITVRQYLDCFTTNTGNNDPSVNLGIFDAGSLAKFGTIVIAKSNQETINKTSFSPCISLPTPKVCFLINSYTTTLDLPDNTAGYVLTVQRCCRIGGIVNLSGNSGNYGVSYSSTIPGMLNGVNYSANSSPEFAQRDTALVCFNSPFSFDFSARDADQDSLSYQFCDGLLGGSQTSPNPPEPSNPPYSSIPYLGGNFSGNSPMGLKVSIDPKTGIISGIAPSVTGDYVVAVCANEYRKGVLFSSTRKEIHITVGNCSISAASLQPSYISCDGTSFSFQNESTNSNINSYLWDFGVSNLSADTSKSPTPFFDYAVSGKDSGTFVLKLKVSTTGGCEDSATALVKVFPGFQPKFSVTGTCVLNHYLFKDLSKTKYGVIDTWRWDLGDALVANDTARSKDTLWKYPAPTNTQVQLIVGNSKGCLDTLTQPLTILDKPTVSLGFRDTLICSIDTLVLNASANSGIVQWTASTGTSVFNMINTQSLSPVVFPKDSTTYYISINDNGCSNTDSVKVNVLKFISVDAGLDTNICQTDTLQLHPISHALSYQWFSSTGEMVDPVKSPLVRPLVNTTYRVTANLGKCQAMDSVRLRVSPYPTVQIGADQTICYGTRAQLNATITASHFSWQPKQTLLNENSLHPIAGPSKSTQYILTVSDTLGCNKSVTDTLLITVIPKVMANAGPDTAILPSQPLRLNGNGGSSYEWQPSTGLDNPFIANPLLILDNTQDSITYTLKVTNQGCIGTDQVTIKVFSTGPSILVPSGFSPNGDGKNEIIKPTLIGITQLNFFSIYNRWGQLLFTTTEINKGWDGMYLGVMQPSGTYVYQTQGLDYLGNTIFKKGTVVLIR